MNITVFNPLSGETIIVALGQGASLPTFETLLYREVIPDAPLGCICYRRADGNRAFEDASEEAQIMRLGELSEEDPDEVTVLFDGLEVIAFVDESILYPTIERNFHVLLIHSRNWSKLLDSYTICFHHREKMVEVDSNLVSSLRVFYDIDEKQWALASTFAETPVYHRHQYYQTYSDTGYNTPYCTTPSTQWFSSLSDCISHTTERTPKDSVLLDKCNDLFRRRAWNDSTRMNYWYDEDEFYQAEDF